MHYFLLNIIFETFLCLQSIFTWVIWPILTNCQYYTRVVPVHTRRIENTTQGKVNKILILQLLPLIFISFLKRFLAQQNRYIFFLAVKSIANSTHKPLWWHSWWSWPFIWFTSNSFQTLPLNILVAIYCYWEFWRELSFQNRIIRISLNSCRRITLSFKIFRNVNFWIILIL